MKITLNDWISILYFAAHYNITHINTTYNIYVEEITFSAFLEI
jgi:hypothetical protein